MKVKPFYLNYKPEKIQAEIHRSLKRFNVIVVSRGGGKSYLSAAELATRAIECIDESGALFVYIAPTRKQAKDVIWEKLKYILGEIPCKIREDELSITFAHNNARIKVEGASDPDSLRGIHPFFVILDEVGDMDRSTWYDVVLQFIDRHNAPVLAIGTPKGPNLFKEMYFRGKSLMEDGNPDWYVVMKDVYDVGNMTINQIEDKKKTMPEAKWRQEQLLDWDAVFTGSYYSHMLEDESIGIITDVPYNPSFPVYTGWDLGIGDLTAVWFIQMVDGKTNVIDYYESANKATSAHLITVLKKPYRYAYHVLPHDCTARSRDTLRSSLDVFKSMGEKVIVAPKLSAQIGISVTQEQLYTTRIDRKKCAVGLEHLKFYSAKMDKLTGEPTDTIDHKHSDAADALRTFFMGYKKQHSQRTDSYGRQLDDDVVVSEYDYFNY